jgi:hypothetical protein
MIRKSQSLLFRQRILIAGLAVALSTGLASSAQAGVIPWVFEVIFGPVHRSVPYSPGPVYSYPATQPQVGYTYRAQSYPSTYSYVGYSSYAGYNGFGCAPCRPSLCQCNPCATAGCAVGTVAPSKTPTTTIAFYHPVYGWVTQSCPTDKPVQTATKTDDVSSGTGDVGSKAPEPKKTYADEIDRATGKKKKDPFQPKPTTSVKKQVIPRNATTEAKNSTENKADKPTNPAGDAGTTTTTTTTSSDDADAKATGDTKKADPGFGEGERKPSGEFLKPKLNEKAEEKKAGEKTDAIKIDDLKKGSDLDNKSSWLVPTLDVKRVAFRPGFRNARLARRAELINVDFVIPATSVTRVVSK